VATQLGGQASEVSTQQPRPLVVVEGSPVDVQRRLGAVIAALSDRGWDVLRGWAAPLTGDRVVCSGTITTATDARRALLAAVAGAGLVAAVAMDRATVDRFLDDLRRLGPVDHVVLDGSAGPALSERQRGLLVRLAEGLTVGDAAAELGIAKRTAARHLALARRTLGVSTNAEAILATLLGGR
jgi:DNA-binding CsgD family transcriptional regulator